MSKFTVSKFFDEEAQVADAKSTDNYDDTEEDVEDSDYDPYAEEDYQEYQKSLTIGPDYDEDESDFSPSKNKGPEDYCRIVPNPSKVSQERMPALLICNNVDDCYPIDQKTLDELEGKDCPECGHELADQFHEVEEDEYEDEYLSPEEIRANRASQEAQDFAEIADTIFGPITPEHKPLIALIDLTLEEEGEPTMEEKHKASQEEELNEVIKITPISRKHNYADDECQRSEAKKQRISPLSPKAEFSPAPPKPMDTLDHYSPSSPSNEDVKCDECKAILVVKINSVRHYRAHEPKCTSYTHYSPEYLPYAPSSPAIACRHPMHYSPCEQRTPDYDRVRKTNADLLLAAEELRDHDERCYVKKVVDRFQKTMDALEDLKAFYGIQ